MKKLLILVLLLSAFGCGDDTLVLPTTPDIPEPVVISGSWTGSARWSGVQGGAPVAITSGEGSAFVLQAGASLSGSWEVVGLFSASFSGTITPEGFVQGTTTVVVFSVPCSSTSTLGGEAKDVRLTLTASFSNPGTVGCAGAPIGLVLSLAR